MILCSVIFLIVQLSWLSMNIKWSFDAILIGLSSIICCFIFPVLKLHNVYEVDVVKAKCVSFRVNAQVHLYFSFPLFSSKLFSNSNCIFPVDKSYIIGFELLYTIINDFELGVNAIQSTVEYEYLYLYQYKSDISHTNTLSSLPLPIQAMNFPFGDNIGDLYSKLSGIS